MVGSTLKAKIYPILADGSTSLPNTKRAPCSAMFKKSTTLREIQSKPAATKSTFNTKTAKSNCRISPVMTNRQLIFRLLLLKAKHTPIRKSIPSIPLPRLLADNPMPTSGSMASASCVFCATVLSEVNSIIIESSNVCIGVRLVRD